MEFEWKFGNKPTQRLSKLVQARNGEIGYEAVIGYNGLSDVIVLKKAWELQRAICWIERGPATGYLVSESTLITNNHVFSNKDHAKDVTVRFGYQLNENRELERYKEFKVSPDVFFWTDGNFDITAVHIEGKPGAEFGYLAISHTPPRVGGPALIIQHPAGMPKQVCLGDNEIMGLANETFFQYLSDTLPGSSGSPVFNEKFELIGTHHRSILTPDGNNYFRNEGVSWATVLQKLPNDVINRLTVT